MTSDGAGLMLYYISVFAIFKTKDERMHRTHHRTFSTASSFPHLRRIAYDAYKEWKNDRGCHFRLGSEIRQTIGSWVGSVSAQFGQIYSSTKKNSAERGRNRVRNFYPALDLWHIVNIQIANPIHHVKSCRMEIVASSVEVNSQPALARISVKACFDVNSQPENGRTCHARLQTCLAFSQSDRILV